MAARSLARLFIALALSSPSVARMPRTLVATWFGAYLVEEGRIVRSVRAPDDPAALAERARLRRAGEITPEELELLSDPEHAEWVTRDRRLASHGLAFDPRAGGKLPAAASVPDREALRQALLDDAERAVKRAWDPSIHLEEAVRAAADLDRVRNLVGERLGSWTARDFPEIDPGDHARAARAALDEGGSSPLGPADPSLRAARRQLAELYRSIESLKAAITDSVREALPPRAPNLAALLGPDLAARLLAQAGGLDRLARLPASTIQVLGAEAAFFEHLRGRAPPPRHGLLFLHPAIQGAPRSVRGKLARALAGKVAIAARLDRAGAAIDPALVAAFEARRNRLRTERPAGRTRIRARRSLQPLDRTAQDR